MSGIDEAFQFYKKHIYDEEKIRLLRAHNLKIAGSVPSVIWELFCSILTGSKGTGGIGVDLKGWEVKSAKNGGSYEYQYHLNTGVEKLIDDAQANHLFCSYSESYSDVNVRAINGSVLAPLYFNQWEPDYRKNYDTFVPSGQRRQRYRKNISYGYIESNAQLLLSITNGVIAFRNDELLNCFNRGCR